MSNKRWLIGSCLLGLGLWLFYQRDTSLPVPPAIVQPTIKKVTPFDSSSVNASDKLPMDILHEVVQRPEPTHRQRMTPDEAITHMRNMLEQGDPRRPELAQSSQREMPTAEEIANPALYEKYEARQNQKLSILYLSQIRRIPHLKAAIEKARAHQEQSEEDVNEATEALEQLEIMYQHLKQKDPALLDSILNANEGI